MMPLVVVSRFMTAGDRTAEINDRQNRENKGLHKRDENMKKNKDESGDGRQRGQSIANRAGMAGEQEKRQRQAQEDDVEQFADEHIDPKTHGEREQPGEVADGLNHDHDRRKID